MIRRGKTGSVQVAVSQKDGGLLCLACMRPIASYTNLGPKDTCPYCHNNVKQVIANNEPIADDDDLIAKPC